MKNTIEVIALSLLLGSSSLSAEMLYVGAQATAENLILKIDPSGQATTVLSNLPTSDAMGLAFDKNGSLFFSNYRSNTITKLSSDGTPSIFANTGLSGPGPLAFDGEGNLYVINEAGQYVVRFDTNAVPTTVFSGRGRTEAVAVAPDGTVYVATDQNNTVWKMATNGNIAYFGSVPFASGLVCDTSGNLYASDYYSTVYKFTPNGIRSVFSNTGMNHPYGLALDAQGNLYVANWWTTNITKYGPDGAYLGVFASGAWGPASLAFAPVKPSGLEISSQPQSQLGYWGKSASFSVGVTNGVPPYTFQWSKDGVSLQDATNSLLVLTNLQATNAGVYTVVVSDTVTNLTSQPATLTVDAAGVAIALYAGVTIDGVAGQTYGVQSTMNLSNTNSWVGRANVTLTNATQLWYDSQPATQPQTYYRVVPGPISIP